MDQNGTLPRARESTGSRTRWWAALRDRASVWKRNGALLPGQNAGATDQSGFANTRIRVVGVGGAGGNAVTRMAEASVPGVEYAAINTDVQALERIDHFPTLAIGPGTTGGMGSGGSADTGRKAVRESMDQVAQLMEGADMVFVTAGMGGGTGTGAAATVAELARKQGALTVGVVTTPFSFEGPRRRDVARVGVDQLRSKVDTLITVDNDRLLPALGGTMSLEVAFRLADQVLRQGVLGISEIITVPGLINVDFADVKAVIGSGGPSFMAVGEGKGATAAADAAQQALSNPLFDAPLSGARSILFNLKGGRDLALAQVHEVAGTIEKAASSKANVIFGVVQDRKFNKRVSITLVATGLDPIKAPFEEWAQPATSAAPALAGATHSPNGRTAAVAPTNDRLI